jgi:hypothetical protein
MENNPRNLFERLFGAGDSSEPGVRLRGLRRDRSILDSVVEEIANLSRGVGQSDRNKLDEYLDGIREVERRIQRAEEFALSSNELPVLERPVGVPASYDEHARIMFELQALALQTDLTRVISFAMAREKSERAYREIGMDEGHHALSHHSGNVDMIAKVTQINRYHASLFAPFVERLKSTQDGDGSLLDHTVVLYCSSMSDGSSHNPSNIPIALLGGASGQLKGGRHLRYTETPVTNLFLTLLGLVGIETDKFGDSSGKADLLSVA